jgi:prolyl 4-hydroxylase
LDPTRDNSLEAPGNRLTSFFVYLEADCLGGTTVFPKVQRPLAEEWCNSLKCHDENGEESQRLEVQPVVGTAIFWYNLDPLGVVDANTLHAGAPVINGTKVGLNIWTRERKYRTH